MRLETTGILYCNLETINTHLGLEYKSKTEISGCTANRRGRTRRSNKSLQTPDKELSKKYRKKQAGKQLQGQRLIMPELSL